MNQPSLHLVQQFLTLVGARTPRSALQRCDQVVRFLRLGRWMTDHGFPLNRRLPSRDAVFATVARRVSDLRVLYLEFGVYEGASMRYWSEHLHHPQALLHGFDSFEGLPSQWDDVAQGTFSTDGNVPNIDDGRVSFFKGWFEDVLPTYTPPEHDVLIINMDADLYESTICALRHLRPWIRPGTYLYFDDLSHIDHEPQAFSKFMDESQLEFRLIATDKPMSRAFFQCVESATAAH